MANGNGVVMKAIIGIIFGSGLLGFMGYGIVNNDIRNTTDHKEIRREIHQAVSKNTEKIDKIKDDVANIRVEQREAITILRRLDK